MFDKENFFYGKLNKMWVISSKKIDRLHINEKTNLSRLLKLQQKNQYLTKKRCSTVQGLDIFKKLLF